MTGCIRPKYIQLLVITTLLYGLDCYNVNSYSFDPFQDKRVVIDSEHEFWNSSDTKTESMSVSNFFWIPDVDILGLRKIQVHQATTPAGGFFVGKDKLLERRTK